MLRSSQTCDTFTGTQEQQPFSFVAPTPFSQFTPLPVVRESAAEAWQTASPTSWLSGDWQIRQGGRGLEVNYRQQRGHRAYYFGVKTCNGPMGMTFMTRARPHPSSPSTPTTHPVHTITHIYTEGVDSGTQWSDNEKSLSIDRMTN